MQRNKQRKNFTLFNALEIHIFITAESVATHRIIQPTYNIISVITKKKKYSEKP